MKEKKDLTIKLKITEGGSGALTLIVYENYPGLFCNLKIGNDYYSVEHKSFEVTDKNIVKKLRAIVDQLEKNIKEF